MIVQTSLIVCRFSASLTKRHNATTSKVHTLFNCCILRKAYFRQCSWHCLKTRRVCLTQTSRIDVCACRARMQQFPKFIFCSTVAFYRNGKDGAKNNRSTVYTALCFSKYFLTRFFVISAPPIPPARAQHTITYHIFPLNANFASECA